MYFSSLSHKCTTVSLIYDEATLHAAGNETVGPTLCITALEAWVYTPYSAERQSLFQISYHGTQGHQEKALSFWWEVGRFRDRCEEIPQPQMQRCQGEIWSYIVKI